MIFKRCYYCGHKLKGKNIKYSCYNHDDYRVNFDFNHNHELNNVSIQRKHFNYKYFIFTSFRINRVFDNKGLNGLGGSAVIKQNAALDSFNNKTYNVITELPDYFCTLYLPEEAFKKCEIYGVFK